jgi:hypothetical protein
MFLSKRYCVEEFDGTHCYRDDGFWYSEVRSFHPPPPPNPLAQHTNKKIERLNSQMDHPRRPLLDFLRLVRRRSHPRQAAATSRETTLGLPSCTFASLTPPSYTHHILTYNQKVPDLVQRTSAPRPSPPESLHLLPNPKPLRRTPEPQHARPLCPATRRCMVGTPAIVPEQRRSTAVLSSSSGCIKDEPEPRG